MAYTKTAWLNNDPNTPLDEVHLNKIESGIENAHVTADDNAADIVTMDTTISSHNLRLDALDGSGGDIETINTELSNISEGQTALEAYHSWRNINNDPGGIVGAETVDNIFVGWAGAVSIQLPFAPTESARIKIVDAGCDFSTNNLTVLRNGNPIMGTTADYTFSNQYGSIEFCWSGATYGWVVTRSV